MMVSVPFRVVVVRRFRVFAAYKAPPLIPRGPLLPSGNSGPRKPPAISPQHCLAVRSPSLKATMLGQLGGDQGIIQLQALVSFLVEQAFGQLGGVASRPSISSTYCANWRNSSAVVGAKVGVVVARRAM
jgi:hypothetical protein